MKILERFSEANVALAVFSFVVIAILVTLRRNQRATHLKRSRDAEARLRRLGS
ncbi:MAG: hypothetical protein R3D68_09270 [Hyphomicrobiaceae bacterium]